MIQWAGSVSEKPLVGCNQKWLDARAALWIESFPSKVSDHRDNHAKPFSCVFKPLRRATVVAHRERAAERLSRFLTTLHAERRWCSADRSPQHAQTIAGKVGESLEPGGSGVAVKSEERNATAWLRGATIESEARLSTGR